MFGIYREFADFVVQLLPTSTGENFRSTIHFFTYEESYTF